MRQTLYILWSPFNSIKLYCPSKKYPWSIFVLFGYKSKVNTRCDIAYVMTT